MKVVNSIPIRNEAAFKKQIASMSIANFFLFLRIPMKSNDFTLNVAKSLDHLYAKLYIVSPNFEQLMTKQKTTSSSAAKLPAATPPPNIIGF